MSRLASRIRGAFRQIENPTYPLTSERIINLLGGEPTTAGVTITAESAMRHVSVYRAVALMAGLMAALPLHAFRKLGERRQLARVQIIEEPHPDKTNLEVWEYALLSLLLHGNSLSHKRRDGLGRIRQLWPLNPGNIKIRAKDEWRDDDNPTGKRFYHSDTEFYTPYEVLHVPGLSYDGVRGLSPIQQARESLATAIAAQQYGGRIYQSGGLIRGILYTDDNLEREDAERLQEDWRQRTQGAQGQHKVPVLSGGVKFEPIQLPPRDALFIESVKWGVTEIARLYGIPPHLLGDVERSTSWGTGIEHQSMQFLVFSVDPWLVRIEQRLTREIARPDDANVYVKFNRAALLRADTQTRYMAYQRAINFGWMSPNEARALEEQEPYEGGDRYWMPMNMQAIPAEDEEPPQEPLVPVGPSPNGQVEA